MYAYNAIVLKFILCYSIFMEFDNGPTHNPGATPVGVDVLGATPPQSPLDAQWEEVAAMLNGSGDPTGAESATQESGPADIFNVPDLTLDRPLPRDDGYEHFYRTYDPLAGSARTTYGRGTAGYTDIDETRVDFGIPAYDFGPDDGYEEARVLTPEEQTVKDMTETAERILEERGVENDLPAPDEIILEDGDEVQRIAFEVNKDTGKTERVTHIRKADGTIVEQTGKPPRAPNPIMEDYTLAQGDVIESIALMPELNERLARIRLADGSIAYRHDSIWMGISGEPGRNNYFNTTRGSFVTMWVKGGDAVLTAKQTKHEGAPAAGQAYASPHFTYEDTGDLDASGMRGVLTSLSRWGELSPDEVKHDAILKKEGNRPDLRMSARLRRRFGNTAIHGS
jgi:hypothetical protein